MLYAEWHRPRGVGLAGAVHRTWAVAEKNDWQFSNPRIDTAALTAFVVYNSACRPILPQSGLRGGRGVRAVGLATLNANSVKSKG